MTNPLSLVQLSLPFVPLSLVPLSSGPDGVTTDDIVAMVVKLVAVA